MTREEFEYAIKSCGCFIYRGHIYYEESELIKAFEDLGLIEQQSCTNAVSREAVNILVDELARAISDERCCISKGRSTATIMQDILDLPSVKPQENTGHWILLDECSNSGYYCSECHKKVVKEGWSNTVKKIKYCPNCGTKMVESLERSDKE